MDEEEVVVPAEEGQTEEQQQQPQRQRQTVSDSLDEIRDKVSAVGEMEENLGKGEQKVADWMDGGEKVTKAASDVGTATSSAAEKSAEAAKKAADVKAKAADATSKAAGGASKAADTARGVAEAASKTADAEKAAAQKAASIPYAGAAISAAGQTAAGIQKGAAETGKAAATGAKASAEGTKAAAEGVKAEAEAEKAAATAAAGAARAAKEGNKAASKANSGLSDKLRERGKFHQAHGKRIQEQANKFDADKALDNIFDKAGNFGKVLKGAAKIFDPKTIGVIVLLFITIGTLVVSYILSPLLYMNIIQSTIADPNRVEKVGNYLSGLGFGDSKETFYKEVDYLNTHYGKQLDVSYIMSALYYMDIYYGVGSNNYSDDNKVMCGSTTGNECGALQIGYQLAKSYIKEANTTTDDRGLVYSANKLYRLRQLAKHQFSGKKVAEATLSEYAAANAEKMQNELGNMSKYTSLLVTYMIAHVNPATGAAFDQLYADTEGGKIIQDFVGLMEGTESWASIAMYFEEGKYDSGVLTAICNFLSVYFGTFVNIENISISLPKEFSETTDFGSYVTIYYYEEKYNADAFEDYLIDYYIRYMPEFSKAIGGLQGKDLEDKITQIAKEIKYTKTIFDSIYKTDESAQSYGECIGDVDLDLLQELTPPIELTKGQSIIFDGSNNYGLYKGIMHKGVDLEESSTNTKAGDNVYSIYDGKVVESTLGDTYSDKSAKGGWLVIEYTIQYEDSNAGNSKLSNKFKSKMSTIRVYYGGLDPNRMTLKQNDIVAKGDVIGYVGDASASENGDKSSVHFGVYDVKNGLFLNPINMFITCKTKATASNSCANGGTTVEIPSSVLDIYQINYDVEQYDVRGFGGNGIDGTSPQKKVHDLWLEDGLRYEKGIAVLNVGGKDRYLVAVTKKFGDIGDIINANLENGEVIELVIADEKNYKHTKAENEGELCDSENTTDPGCYGHYKGSEGLGVLEFDFNPVEIFQNGIYSASAMGLDWDTSQKVISISNCGSVFDE